MSGFRAGDKIVEIRGREHRLRMSVSALAELAAVFEADSPKALATRLRRATLTDWNRILRAMAMPGLGQNLGRSEIEPLLPILSNLIREGLRA